MYQPEPEATFPTSEDDSEEPPLPPIRLCRCDVCCLRFLGTDVAIFRPCRNHIPRGTTHIYCTACSRRTDPGGERLSPCECDCCPTLTETTGFRGMTACRIIYTEDRSRPPRIVRLRPRQSEEAARRVRQRSEPQNVIINIDSSDSEAGPSVAS